MKKLSFVIPCYGSEHTIGTVVSEVVGTVEADGRYDYEIILVNDSSPDKVFDVITKLAEENPHIKGIDLARNFGQHSAIMTGFSFVTGDITVALDDDGQTPANEMFKLIDSRSIRTKCTRALGTSAARSTTKWLSGLSASPKNSKS